MADELVAMGDDAEELQPEDRELKDKTRKWLEERAEGHWHAEECDDGEHHAGVTHGKIQKRKANAKGRTINNWTKRYLNLEETSIEDQFEVGYYNKESEVTIFGHRKGGLRVTGSEFMPCRWEHGRPHRNGAGIDGCEGFVFMQQGADYMHWFKPARDADDDCATMEEWCYLLQAAGSKMVKKVGVTAA